MGLSKSSSKREVYRDTIIPQKQEKHRIDSLTLHLKQLEKEEQNPPKISRRKVIINIRAEINEKEMKETIAKINKTKFFEINKIDKPLAGLSRKEKNRRKIKATKLEMERLQQTMQKYKGL